MTEHEIAFVLQGEIKKKDSSNPDTIFLRALPIIKCYIFSVFTISPTFSIHLILPQAMLLHFIAFMSCFFTSCTKVSCSPNVSHRCVAWRFCWLVHPLLRATAFLSDLGLAAAAHRVHHRPPGSQDQRDQANVRRPDQNCKSSGRINRPPGYHHRHTCQHQSGGVPHERQVRLQSGHTRHCCHYIDAITGFFPQYID